MLSELRCISAYLDNKTTGCIADFKRNHCNAVYNLLNCEINCLQHIQISLAHEYCCQIIEQVFTHHITPVLVVLDSASTESTVSLHLCTYPDQSSDPHSNLYTSVVSRPLTILP